MNKYPAYSEYKDSGVDWLDDIPEHWSTWKLNHFAPVLTCGVAATPEYVDEGVAFLSAQNVKNRKVDLSKGYKFISQKSHEALTKNRAPRNGDILLSRVGTVGEVCIVDVDFEFSIFVSLTHLRINQDVCINRFFVFLCQAAYIKALHGAVTLVGGGVGNLNVNDLREYRLPIPPCEEQEKIANFLDHETAQIDTLIEKQQQLVKLLKEKRQAVISHAVTKGLNPNAPMRDSGVEWLGEVPKHWKIVPLSSVSDVVDPNPSHRNPVYTNEGFPFISTIEFIGVDDLEMNTPRRVAEVTVQEQERRCNFQKGSIAFSRKGTIGAVRILPYDARFALLDSVCVINSGSQLEYKFLYQQVRSSVFYSQLGQETRGAALPQVSVGKVRSVKVFLPPLEEQQDIVNFLSEKLSKLGKSISLSEKQIILLRERRTALISATVTGKIDVRSWQAPKSATQEAINGG